MIERGDQAIVVGRGFVADHARIRRRCLRYWLPCVGFCCVSRKREALVARCGAVGACCAWFDRSRTCGNDPVQPVPLAPQTPGIKTAGSNGDAHGIVAGGVADVVDLRLPAVPELTLDAEGPLNGVGGLEVRHRHDVLRLREEESL